MNNRPIGVFDSGLGGISVLNHLVQLLPAEDFIYVADSAWCPYGNKSSALLRHRISRIVDFFLKQKVKLIVVACNTATAVAIEYLRSSYKIPFVGMEPAIKPAAKLTKTNTIGVLATSNTFKGQLFHETKQRYASHINMVIKKGCGLVELVENNQTDSTEAFCLIEKYTTPMVEAAADYLVLGCTHYPFLSSTIRSVAPSLNIIDPALPVAKRAKQLLADSDQFAKGKPEALKLLTTGQLSKLNNFAGTFIQKNWEASNLTF